MGWIDRLTLLLVLLGATHLGLLALGIELTTDLAPVARKGIYGLFGVSALWQWSRQRLY